MPRRNEDQSGKAVALQDRGGNRREILERVVERDEYAVVCVIIRALMPVDEFAQTKAPAAQIGQSLHLHGEDVTRNACWPLLVRNRVVGEDQHWPPQSSTT